MLLGFDSMWVEPKILLIKNRTVKHYYFLKNIKIILDIKPKIITLDSIIMNKNN
jgi:hypothetical protein